MMCKNMRGQCEYFCDTQPYMYGCVRVWFCVLIRKTKDCERGIKTEVVVKSTFSER